MKTFYYNRESECERGRVQVRDSKCVYATGKSYFPKTSTNGFAV